jgi:hypothetical protein
MATKMSLWGRLTTGITAFREAFVTAGLQQITEYDFSDFDARRLRYEMYWAFYENSAYRNIHKWAQRMKTEYGLYRHIRNIYNPSYRLGEFWKMHLMGGILDPMAGDGKFKPNALPIIIPEENQDSQVNLRKAIAQIWKWSNWQINKDILTLHGPIFGDVGLMVVDDLEKGQVYIDVIHPGTIYDIETDPMGNVKSYTLLEQRVDPDNANMVATYKEEAIRGDGESVVYRTFKNEEPYPWDNEEAEWSVDYGFIPLVIAKHNDVGLEWGWSELHAGRPKFQELDDLASKTNDHIRKSVDPPWFFSGVSKRKGEDQLSRAETEPTEDRPQPQREELNAIYAGNERARATPLIADLELEAALKGITEMMEEVERDYPELQMDVWRAIQTNSGRALRLARQRSEVKVIQRRANYDNALIRAQSMAISIASLRNSEGEEGYDSFAGFNIDSFKEGKLEHYIGNRSVYGKDPLDDLEIDQKFWEVATIAEPLIGLEYYLQRAQWDEKDIKDAVEAYEKRKEELKEQAQNEQANMRGDNGNMRPEKESKTRIDKVEE